MAENVLINKNKRANTLDIIGIVLVFIGAIIAIVKNPLRGSGFGAIFIAAGLVLIIIALLRFNARK
jgi:hypothetical protein